MALLANFISELAAVTGTKSDSLTAFVEANKTVEIPDDIMNGIKNGIFTLEAAKNSPTLHDHFVATARAGIDEEVYATLKEYGATDDAIKAAKEEKKTIQKVRMLAHEIKNLEAAKIQATGGEKKVLGEKIEALTQQVADANAEIVKLKAETDARMQQKEAEMLDKLRDYQIERHYASYTPANEKMKPSVFITMARALEGEALKELDLKTVFDKETGKVKLLTSKDTIYYKDSKPVTYEEFTNSLLADNHLLKVSDKPKAGDNPQNNVTIKTTNGQSATPQRDTTNFTNALKEQLAEVKVDHN